MEWVVGVIGEIASNIVIEKLKDWFENLSQDELLCYHTGVEGLKESLLKKIEIDIQTSVESTTWRQGGSTLVCAIIGENDTLVANIGDSRAYIVNGSDIKQISREDTEAKKNVLKRGIEDKELERFDAESNVLVQCIGMDREDLNHPFVTILKNTDYDMLLLFSDGVTDCLSDEDIAVVCRNSNKKELAKKIVEKAMSHDSFLPEKYNDYSDLLQYIPGGKDNTSAIVSFSKENDDDR